MTRLPKRRIAAAYLPDQHSYWYSLSKLALDPLYDSAPGAFASDGPPVLDLGCGLGLLLHCLRANGRQLTYLGVDSDHAKIEKARSASVRGEHANANFQVCDLSEQFPQHRGSIAMLDVLQYLTPTAQEALISRAAQCITRDGQLVIRTALADGSWRSSWAQAADRFGHKIGWMRSSFKAQPTKAMLEALLHRHGLRAEFRPLWGRTPFNNWLVIARQG